MEASENRCRTAEKAIEGPAHGASSERAHDRRVDSTPPALVVVAGCVVVAISSLITSASAHASTSTAAATQGPGQRSPSVAVTASNAWQRAEWGYTQRAFPLGYIPQGARAAALREIAESRLLGRPGASNTTSVEAATAAGRGNSALAKWRNLGPAPIVSSGTRFSGRVADIAVDPTNSRRWLIGAAQGGIWETLDDGSTWKPLTDDQASMSMGAIAFSPSEPTTIYAGTGEATFSGVSYGGAGVLKSTDGGATWELVGDRDLDGFAFSDLAVDPATSLTIVGATARGTHVLNSYQKPTGIYRSTDGGARWTRMLAGQATDLEVDPSDFNRQVAGIGEIFGDEANGLYRSVDAGVSWTRVAGPWDGGNIGRVELALAPSDSEVLYVSVEDSSDSELLGLWKTRDAFATSPTWETIRVPSVFGRGSYCSPQCWYDHEIIVDPASSDRLFAGGLSLWRMGPSGWASVTPDHVDQHSMAWADGRLIVGNDGGVFSTLSRGEHWTNHNRNLVLTQFYHGAMHPKRLSTMLAGSQDNGTQLRDGKGDAIVNRNDKWTEVFGGDGADMEFSSDSPETAWALSFQRLGIVRTLNGGSSFILATRGIDRSTAPFIGVFAKCPQDEDVFITGTGQLYRTNTFFRGRSPLWRPQGPLLASGDTVTAVAFSTSGSDCSTYAYGTQRGRILITTNGGRRFRDADRVNTVPGRTVTDVAFDPSDKSRLYVSLSGFNRGTPGQPGHVFMTTDGARPGAIWTDIGPRANLPFNSLVVHPGTGRLWVGSDIGVWEQLGAVGSSRWAHHGPPEGLPNVAVFDLQASDNGVVAYTHGRGAFVLADS